MNHQRKLILLASLSGFIACHAPVKSIQLTQAKLGQPAPQPSQITGAPPPKSVKEAPLQCPPCTVQVPGYWHFDASAGWQWAKSYCDAAQTICPQELGCPTLVSGAMPTVEHGPASAQAQSQAQAQEPEAKLRCFVSFVPPEYLTSTYRPAYLRFLDSGRTTEVRDQPRSMR